MKNRIVKFSLLSIVLLLCTACNGNVTRDLRHDGFNVAKKFICEDFYPKNNKDTGYKKVKYLTDSNIIDTEGHLYEVSLDQIYSNKENCKKANTDITVTAIFDNKVVKGTDNKYYYLNGENNIPRYGLIPDTDKSMELYNLILKEDSIIKVMTVDSNKGIYYVLKNDGNVYSYTITRAEHNSPLRVVSRNVVYDRYDYKARIIDFNYVGEDISTYIKTENSLYRMTITNEECKKYADVECRYSMLKDEVLEKYDNKIIAFNGNTLITDYKQVFTVNQ